MKFIDYSNIVLDQIRNELSLPKDSRLTGAEDIQLKWAIQTIENRITTVQNGKLPSIEKRYSHLSKMVTDSWNLKAPLSNSLLELEYLYKRLKENNGT